LGLANHHSNPYFPTILLNINNVVGDLQNPFANIRAALHFLMENAAMDIGGTKPHVLNLVRAKAKIQGQPDVLRLSNDPILPTFIIRFLAAPLNSVTNYPVIVYCAVFTEIMHFLKRRVKDWEDFVLGNKELTQQMDWELKKKNFINEFIAFALFCSIKGSTVAVDSMQTMLHEHNVPRCPIWEFFIAPMLYVAYTNFPSQIDLKCLLGRNMYQFYKNSRKQLTLYGTVSLSYLPDNYSHEESSTNVHYLKAMPIDFWKLLKFYHRRMNFNPYDGTKVKTKGKTERHYYNVLTVELESAKLYPNLECVGGIRMCENPDATFD
jgi:hypothetical protein